jgi:hypothetical protein
MLQRDVPSLGLAAISLACAESQLRRQRLVRDRVWVFSGLASLCPLVMLRVGTCPVVSLPCELPSFHV